MVKKQRRAVVQNIIKNLLDSEIPEIQAMAKKLADQIKKLEEHSFKLQDYVTQIENLATEEASAMVESRISEILKDLDTALGELKQRSKKAAIAGSEISAPPKKAEAVEKGEREEKEVEEQEAESIVPRPGLKPEAYSTPEGYIIKKSRH
jgi:septal ring factor EnvC (AmiA/AmiB activator)